MVPTLGDEYLCLGKRLVRAPRFVLFIGAIKALHEMGDVFPIGYLRLIACVSPLNGSLLLAWSGSFLFLLIRDDFVDKYVP